MIAFIGSVFSPYYAWSRRFGAGDPARHCTLNVALYGAKRGWAMTERGCADRGPSHLAIGPSSVTWDGAALSFRIDERTMPFAGRLRGEVRVHPQAMTGRSFFLDTAGRHRWSPLSPRAKVEVVMENPDLRWSGAGYLDSNDGDVPLEQSFSSWTWSRAVLGDRTAILYDVMEPGGARPPLALLIDGAGGLGAFPPPPVVVLPKTGWRVGRETRADLGQASVRETLEDTPFYARSVLSTRLLGEDVPAMHESLSLTRFRLPVVQAMLPFRMPRTGGR